MKRAVYVLRMAHIYAQRVDWMLSGDDGEEDLVKLLDKELMALKEKYPNGKFTYKKHRVRYDDDEGRWIEGMLLLIKSIKVFSLEIYDSTATTDA